MSALLEELRWLLAHSLRRLAARLDPPARQVAEYRSQTVIGSVGRYPYDHQRMGDFQQQAAARAARQ